MPEEKQDQIPGVVMPQQSLMDIFNEPSFGEKVRLVMYGLKQPKDTGAYKYARLQMVRLQSPAAGIIVPALAILLLGIFTAVSSLKSRDIPVKMIDPARPPELEKPEPLPEEKIEPPDPIEVEIPIDREVDVTNPDPSPPIDFSPQPAAFDSVAIVKSPVIMRGIMGSRSPGMRGLALRRFGGSGATEDAVMRALRWLKKNQAENGSWGAEPVAFTGFALLAYLAHGETPSSPEFGKTVEKGIKHLIDAQGGGEIYGSAIPYRHQIATYAICEAYTMTKLPQLKASAEKALGRIISGQNPVGGWNYQLRPCDRNDMSVGAWCAQAVKAGKIAGLTNPGLDQCIKQALGGARNNYQEGGGFGYTSPQRSGLSGAGTLWMQLLGEPSSKEVKATIENVLSKKQFAMGEGGDSWKKIYFAYYDTQAIFHYGGEPWTAWNKQFAPALVNSQNIEPKAIEGPDGKMKDIGHWLGGRDPAMQTALCTLMLEVYYRYLPTFAKPEDFMPAEAAGGEAAAPAGAAEPDVPIVIKDKGV